MQELGLVVPRTHDLENLLTTNLLPHDAGLRILLRGLVILNRYSVDIRYPEENTSKRQAVAALRHAGNVRAEIRVRLGLPP